MTALKSTDDTITNKANKIHLAKLPQKVCYDLLG